MGGAQLPRVHLRRGGGATTARCVLAVALVRGFVSTCTVAWQVATEQLLGILGHNVNLNVDPVAV